MKCVKHAYALILSIIWILAGQAWSNEAPGIFVQSYVSHIVAGGHHSIAIDEAGSVWSWGNNGSGRLGNADAGLKASIPVPVGTTNNEGQLTHVISVDAGFSHSIALLEDGSVMTWGNNTMLQLGNASIGQSSYMPVYVNGPDEKTFMTNVIAVAAGNHHSVALCSDGSVWTWGTNTYGQLGNSTPLNRSQNVPTQVRNSDDTGFLTEVIAISAGAYHTLALKKNGIVMAWGSNEKGQLGLGSDAVYHQTPFPINELTDITHIDAGASHSLARKSNGTVWAWGSNEKGQLGYPTNNNSFSNSPHQVLASDGINNLMNVVNIAAGGFHSLALKDDCIIMGWGNNNYGQLGDGSETSTIYPTSVKRANSLDLLDNVVDISAGANHSLARLKNGQIMAWGDHNDGQLGNNGKKAILPDEVLHSSSEGTLQLGEQSFFVHVYEDQVSDAIPIILRDSDGQQVTLSAISSNESLIAPENFEFNNNNQPFTLSTPSEESVNIFFSFQTLADQFGSGVITIIATDSLGASDRVQLKVNVLPVNDPPVISHVENIEINEDTATNIIPFTVIDVDGDHLTVSAQSLKPSLIPMDGLILSGNSKHRHIQIYPNPNQFGAADIILSVSDPSGLSSQTHFYVNVKPVNDSPSMRIWPGVRQVVCGFFHNIAIKHDWTLWAWGYNGEGQLGDGTKTPHNLPIQVKGPDGIGWLTDIIAVAAGNQHSVALTGDGHVLTWGGNTFGQLGNGTFESSEVPIYVMNEYDLPLDKVSAIAGGSHHVLILTEENELWGWGKNENGQLAHSTPTSYNRPIRIQGLPSNRIVQIAAGDAHSMVLLDNGEILSWGDNAFGQLGIGNAISSMIPTLVLQANETPLTNIVSITAGAFHSLALSNNGEIWAFGKNQNGELGIGSTADLSIPATVQHPENGHPLSDIVFIASGASHSLAIQNNGTIWAWGNNKYGQLGNGTQNNQLFPKTIDNTNIPVDNVLTIDAGNQHTILHAGNVWAWGANYSFQLGIGTSNGSLVPVQTLSPDGTDVFSPGVFPLEFYTSDGIPAQPVLVSLHDLETPTTDLILTAVSYDTQILPHQNILFQGTGVNRQVILTPENNRTGKVVVELSVSDSTDSVSKQLTLGVNKFSLAPTISDINHQVANEDQVMTNINLTIEDPDTPFDQLTIQVTSSNTDLVPNHPDMIKISGDAPHKTLTITPLENKYGETVITIRVSDGINIARSSFTLTIHSVNDPPQISEIEDQEIISEEFSKTIGFMVSDVDTEPKSLTTWVVSSNEIIVPNDSQHLIISGNESQRTLAITPEKDEAGELTITIYVNDGIETQSTSFQLMVQSFKKSPQISEIQNQIMQEDSEISVNITVTDADSDPNELSFSIVSSNPIVIPNNPNHLSLSGTNGNRTLHIKPNTDQVGSVRITIEARDLDDLYDQTSFVVTVKNINDPPTLSKIDDVEIKENQSTPPIEFSIHDPELSPENLYLTVTSSNTYVVPNDSFHIKMTGEDNNRSLILTPLEDTTGKTTIRIQLSDGEIPVWESFLLIVSPENFPPEISPIGLQVAEVNTPLEISFTATDQEMPSYLLDLSVMSSDPSIVPNDTEHLTLETGVENERRLTITPLDDMSGQLKITLRLKDDLSTTEQSFTLVVNHPPNISSVSDQETDEDTPIAPQISFIVSDADSDSDQLKLSAYSTNQDLIPNDEDHLSVWGNGYYRFLDVIPAANQFGQTHITVEITDGYSVRQTGFDVNVLPINDPPFIRPVSPIITNEDVPVSSVQLTVGDLETSAEFLPITIISDNEALLSVQNIRITGQTETRYLSLTPTANQYGNEIVILKISDPEGLTTDQGFTLQVKSVNDCPMTEDQTYHTRINVSVSSTLIANDIDGDTLTYAISAKPEKGNVTLLNASTGLFSYQPYLNQYGMDTFLFVASDGIETSVEGTATLFIQDNIPPEIILDGQNPDYIMQGGYHYNDPYVKMAYDNADGNLIDFVVSIGDVNPAVPGTYHVTYRVKDNSGNVAQVVREVVVMENAGQLEGKIINIPDDITDPKNAIRVQLLDAISGNILSEAEIFNDYQTFRFKFKYQLPFQAYILRLIVKTPGYLTETKDQLILFQSNKQEVPLSIPELTAMNLCYQLSVTPDGHYKKYDTYQYTIIDYLTGKTIKEETTNASQFKIDLKKGSYRLIIIAKGYEPYEYEHNGNSFIRIDTENESISVFLKENAQFIPDDIRLDISHTLFHTDTDHGFYLWFVRKSYHTEANFRVTIQSENEEIELNGIDLIDNHPYVYTWTVAAAEKDPQKPLYQSKEPINSEYTIVFHFYQETNIIQSYTVNYVQDISDSTPISPEKQSLQHFMNETVRYETQSKTKFYPLTGVDLNLSFKDSTGDINHKGVSIPPIPLEYLETTGHSGELTATKEIVAHVTYYTFGGDGVSDGISIEFKTLNGDQILYNAKDNRKDNAPEITVPLHLNRYSSYFEGIQRNRLSQAKDILHVVVRDSSNPSAGFQKEPLPFMIQDDGLVLLKIKHLSTITLEIDENWNAFNDKSLDDGRCFIDTMNFSNGISQLFILFIVLIWRLSFLRKTKGKKS